MTTDYPILTTVGVVMESALDRKVIFEDRPDKYVVSVEWRKDGELVRRDAFPSVKPGEPGNRILTVHGLLPKADLERTITYTDDVDEFTIVTEYRMPGGGEPVHRSAHVILKRATVEAQAMAGVIG